MRETFVAGERGKFTKSAQTSFTLPSRYYLDQDVLDQENRLIFQRSWLYAGHITDLPEQGSFVALELAGQPIVILRGKDNQIRVFFNVCQHRGHLLVEGRGQVKNLITCPYHAWCYSLDGKLKTARMTKDVRNFDPSEFGLRPVTHTLVAGMVFVNFDATATPESGELPAFEMTILSNLTEMPTFVARHRFDFNVAANWKVVIDNFSEGYHIPVAHPTLSKLYNEQTANSTIGRRFSFFEKTARPGFGGFETTGKEPYLTWFLWPNLCLLSLPGAAQLIVLRISPNGPNASFESADIYCSADRDPPNLDAVKSLFSEMFNREDIALVESVQKGLASEGYDQGRYVADSNDSWFSESGLHRFHSQILDALGEEL